MKKFFKIGCLGLIAIIALIIVLAVIGSGDDKTSTSKKEGTTKTETTTSRQKDKEGVLTEEKFAKIEQGMTYEQVVDIVGAEGTVLSETGTPGDQFHTVIYEFETDGFLSSANMTFQGGKLLNKSQAGLGTSDIKITLDQFNQLQNGMSKEQVFEILGGEGEIISESDGVVMYTYYGDSVGGNASLMFQDGKLINKSQFGLE